MTKRRCVLVVLACLVHPGEVLRAQEPAAPEGGGGGGRAAANAAFAKGDEHGMFTALEAAWTEDPRWARESAFKLLQRPEVGQRAVGLAVLRRRADVESLASAAAALNVTGHPDERRMLVRAMGSGDVERAPALVERFLRDTDPLVAAAAAQALADLDRPTSVGLLAKRLGAPPAERGSWKEDKQSVLEMALHGAARSLSGLRPSSAREVVDWWQRTQGRDGKAALPDMTDAEVERGKSGGQVYFASPNFNVYLRVEGVTQPEASGDLSWMRLAETLERAGSAARRASEPVFGRVHLPVIRVYVCDPKQYPALAGESFMGGVARGNEVVLRLGRRDAMMATMAHEMVHIIHSAHFIDQPRWLSEGLAESLARSPQKSAWREPSAVIAARELAAGGAFASVVGWSSGATSGAQESGRYAASHLAVDFLRHGGWAAAEERLCFLMGRLSRGTPTRQALEQVYGANTQELDRRLKEWVAWEPDPATARSP